MTGLPQYWWAEAGRKVVCVHKHGWFIGDTRTSGPNFGEVLIISRVIVEDETGDIGFRFDEYRDEESAFIAKCFRPLFPEKRETDIAQFKALLTPTHERERTDA